MKYINHLNINFYNNNKPKISTLWGISDMERTSTLIAHVHTQEKTKFQSPVTSDFPKSISTPAGQCD